MDFTSQYKKFYPAFATKLPKLKLWGLPILLSACASAFCFSSSASAAESIVLIYNETQTSTSVSNLQALISRGEMTKNLQEFFRKVPQNSKLVGDLLTARIPISPAFVEQSFKSSTGQFLLIQFDQLLSTSLRQENLEPLRSALAAAYGDDNRFSVLEVIEEYPKSEVRLNLRNLAETYNDVSTFITRIQPLLALTRELIPELMCDCENPPRTSKTVSQANLPQLEVPGKGHTFRVDGVKPGCSKVLDRQSAFAELEATAAQRAVIETKLLISSAAVKLAETSRTLELGTSAPAINQTTPSPEAKQFVLTFGPFSRSFSIRELETIAATGKVPRSIGIYLEHANISPEGFRKLLVQELQVSSRFLDQSLNSLLGEYLLFQVGQMVHTPSRRANIQAIRSALVMSTLRDNRISLLEFLQKYPLQQVYVDGTKLARVVRDSSRLAERGVDGCVASAPSQARLCLPSESSGSGSLGKAPDTECCVNAGNSVGEAYTRRSWSATRKREGVRDDEHTAEGTSD